MIEHEFEFMRRKPTRAEMFRDWFFSQSFKNIIKTIVIVLLTLMVVYQARVRATDTQSLRSIIAKQAAEYTRMKNERDVLYATNEELRGNGIKLPAMSTFMLLKKEGVIK